MYWEEEATVTVQEERELLSRDGKETSKGIGDLCTVKFGSKYCTGKIAKFGMLETWLHLLIKSLSLLGTKAAMLTFEKDYLAGLYTPFEPGKQILKLLHAKSCNLI